MRAQPRAAAHSVQQPEVRESEGDVERLGSEGRGEWEGEAGGECGAGE